MSEWKVQKQDRCLFPRTRVLMPPLVQQSGLSARAGANTAAGLSKSRGPVFLKSWSLWSSPQCWNRAWPRDDQTPEADTGEQRDWWLMQDLTPPPLRCQKSHFTPQMCSSKMHSKMMWEQIYQCLDITDWLLHHIKKKKIQLFSLSYQQLPPRSLKERKTQVEHTECQSSGQICDSAGNSLLAGDSRQTGRQWQHWLQEQIGQRNLKVTPVAIQKEREKRGR